MHYSKLIQFLPLTFVLVIAASNSSCAQKTPNSNQIPANSESFQTQMQNLSLVLTELIPMIADSKKFNDPQNAKVIQDKAVRLSELSHSVQKVSKAAGSDPTVEFILDQFSDDTKRAVEALKVGHRGYAQHLLRNTTTYCIQCHTRTQVGPVFFGNSFETALSKLAPLEKGEVLAATRQFEAALKEFRSIIESPRDKQPNVFVWDKAVRYSLAIAIKFQNDPKEAMSIIDIILSSESAPFYLKQDAKIWKSSIQSWIKEPRIVTRKPGQLIEKAQSLINQSQKNFDFERAGQVQYLRASSMLHMALDIATTNSEKSEALYWIGICYENFKDIGFWSMDERYFEACIRVSPHSDIANKCYQKYEENVFLGYTGSQGTTLPPDIQQKLFDLKLLAKPGI
jgi:tetratricopeptide (TPR) repeat protein